MNASLWVVFELADDNIIVQLINHYTKVTSSKIKVTVFVTHSTRAIKTSISIKKESEAIIIIA